MSFASRKRLRWGDGRVGCWLVLAGRSGSNLCTLQTDQKNRLITDNYCKFYRRMRYNLVDNAWLGQLAVANNLPLLADGFQLSNVQLFQSLFSVGRARRHVQERVKRVSKFCGPTGQQSK